jgi:GR25 family glycosyltransferase involved in LPS biosynthesis
MFILEDDARLSPKSEQLVYNAVNEYENGPFKGDLLYLLSAIPYVQSCIRTYAKRYCKPISKLLKRITVHHDFAGGAAYVIGPGAARALLKRTSDLGAVSPDAAIDHCLNEGRIGVVVMAEDERGFMLNDHWSTWNHVHNPEEK